MEYMKFTAFSNKKDLFSGSTEDKIGDYEVKINPESFDRSISVATVDEDKNDKGSGSKTVIGSNAETYSFDLLFDGTGVASSISSAAELKKDFNNFLCVVYRKSKSDSAGDKKTADKQTNNGNPDQNKKPPVNAVKIHYCGEDFNAQLDSLSIKYLLFDKESNPLRIKVSCRFSSLDEESSTNKDGGSSDKKGSSAPPVNKDTPNSGCVHTEESFEETVASAQQNDAVCLMTCSYPRETMTERNYTPADFTPVEGYDI